MEATPLIRVPFQGCPDITNTGRTRQIERMVSTQLVFRRVNANIHMRNGVGDITIDGGTGSFFAQNGQGALTITDRRGWVSSQAGKGNVQIKRFLGSILLDHGTGDISVTECTGDLFIGSGTGLVDVAIPKMQRLSIYARAGDIRVVDGDLLGARMRTDAGSVLCTCRFRSDEGSRSLARGVPQIPTSNRKAIPVEVPELGTFEIESHDGNISVGLDDQAQLQILAIAQGGKINSGLTLSEGSTLLYISDSRHELVGSLRAATNSSAEPRAAAVMRISALRGNIELMPISPRPTRATIQG
jgi:hypothetical protein